MIQLCMKVLKGSHGAIYTNKKVKTTSQEKKMSSDVNRYLTSKKTDSQTPAQVKPSERKATPIVIIHTKNESHPLAASQVSRELLRIKGSWPFDLAPDELIIEEKRLIIKRNNFPFGGSVVTLPLQKLTTFEVNQAYFYSALYIKGEGNTLNTIIQWLKPEDALKAKEVVDGLRLKESESIEIKTENKEEMVEALKTLGQT